MEETRITFEEGTRRIVLPQAVKQIMGCQSKERPHPCPCMDKGAPSAGSQKSSSCLSRSIYAILND